MQGVPGTTQDVDLWFERYSSREVLESFRAAGGTLVWRAIPPVVAGPPDLEIVDVVRGCTGLGAFREEYEGAIALVHDATGIVVPVLPVERVLVSKRAADRPKDRLAVPIIEQAIAVMMRSRRG
jgi:hypothetical protein